MFNVIMSDSVFTIFNVVRIFTVATVAFFVTLLITPLWTKILYKYKLGKGVVRETSAPIFSQLHKKKIGIPTMGGVVIWVTVVVLTIGFWLVSRFYSESFLGNFNFLSRGQTWVPLAALITTALFSLLDDFLGVLRIGPGGGG